jgi:regulator of chromosome condensation
MPPRRSTRAGTREPPATATTSRTKRSTAATTQGASTKTSTAAKSSPAKTAGATGKRTATASAPKEPKPKPARTTTPAPKKRKAADEDEPAREPKKTKVTKPRAPPAPKPKVVINQAPTTKLNVYVCGEGSAGELGLGPAKTSVDVKRPRLNPLLSAGQVGVVQVAVGGMHCVALTHDNKILTWGVNDQGALGRDTAWEGGYKDIDDNKSESDSEEDDPGLNPRESTPTAIPSGDFPEGTVFVEVAAGDSSSFALTDDGLVYGWGTFRVRHL